MEHYCQLAKDPLTRQILIKNMKSFAYLYQRKLSAIDDAISIIKMGEDILIEYPWNK